MNFEECAVDLNASCACGCMISNRFPNRYGASTASNLKIRGFPEIGYRLLPPSFQTDTGYEKVKLPCSDHDILECDVWDEVSDALQRIRSI